MRYSASDKTEIIRLVEQSPWPARRTLEKLGIPRSSFYRWYDRYQRGGPEALADRPSAGSDLELNPGGYPLPDCQPGAGSAGTEPAGTGSALHGRGKILCLRGFGLSASEGARSYHQPGLHLHQSVRGVKGQDHGAQPALADRLQLSQVLSFQRAGRLLALHCRAEAPRDDESAGCDFYALTSRWLNPFLAKRSQRGSWICRQRSVRCFILGCFDEHRSLP